MTDLSVRTTRLDPVSIQLLWNRLISVVDEAASGLIRTAYTPSVKEYHDFCCALFDDQARMLSHSTVTTAGFLGVVPEVMGNFVRHHSPETLKPGDVLITNDPWLASGHLIVLTESGDVALVEATPARHNEIASFSAIQGKTWNHPAISGGRLLVRNTTEMACFKIAP